METKHTAANQRTSLQDKVLGQILKMMEGGKIPWRCPWRLRDMRPTNLCTNEIYRGFNAFWLGFLGGSKYWLGMQQANQLGGRVRKGESGTPIIFPRLKKVTEKETDGTEKECVALTGFSGSYVWNLNQIYGIEEPKDPQEVERVFNTITAAENIVSGMPNAPQIFHGASGACYQPKHDMIQLPPKGDFESEEEYFSVLYHELGHSTGHSSRLNRKAVMEPSGFGSHEYSKEELIAEFAASYLCTEAGIERATIQNSAAYIQSWARALKDDKTMIFFAAAQAEKAAKYILDIEEGAMGDAESQRVAA